MRKGFRTMEKLRREIKELGESGAHLHAIVDYLVNEKKIMGSKANHIFMLDMQDYIAALNRLAPSTTEITVEPHEVKQINYLLTRQYELIKLIQRDIERNIAAKNIDLEQYNEKQLKRLKTINQLLLQDNLVFQAMLDSTKIGSNIRVGQKKNWLQRLFRK